MDWILFRWSVINNTHRTHCVAVTAYITAHFLNAVDWAIAFFFSIEDHLRWAQLQGKLNRRNYFGVTHCENSEVEIGVFSKWNMLREWFGFTDVLFRAVVALYHVNDVLRVTVHVMSYIRCDEWSDFTCRVECLCLSLTLSLYVRPWRRKAVPSEILVTKIYILDLKINLASFVWYFYIQLSRSFIRIQSFFFVTLVLASKIEIIRSKHG